MSSTSIDERHKEPGSRRYILGSVLTLAALSIGTMTFLMLAYSQRASLIVDIPDPGIDVRLNGMFTITGPNQEKVIVQPGQQELTIRQADAKL